MDLTNKQPTLEETINAMSDVQLHRYNATTLELMQESLASWAQELSTPERPVKHYFIQSPCWSLPLAIEPDIASHKTSAPALSIAKLGQQALVVRVHAQEQMPGFYGFIRLLVREGKTGRHLVEK